MLWGIAAVVVFIWVGRKLRPAHLGDDILKFELFRRLRYRNAADAAANMTYEDLEKKLWTQTGVAAVVVFVCTYLTGNALGFTSTESLWTSASILGICGIVWRKSSKTYRQITLPLFATLCRIPQSRWDMRGRPWNWVKVSPKKGKVWIRLPKDWHATKLQLKSIAELVNARIPGHWTMSVNTSGFLLTFTREVDAETVAVSGNDTPTLPIDEWIATEKEVEDGPW